jgi:CBS-domain-containing membrane protein
MAYSTLSVQSGIGSIPICRPQHGQQAVTMDSPALSVMTDLTQVSAAVVDAGQGMDAAHEFMMQRGVRMLLVLDAERRLAGLLTATDLLGEKPVELVHDRRMKHADITVADLMTPADRLDAFDMHTLQSARVGHVVASLQHARRHHALVVQRAGDTGREVRGIFSLSQIARQLGMPLQLPEQARTFAELEAALV